MIEAVNSVLANASATRSVVAQQATSNSLTANPERTQQAAVKTPYVSPYISIDRQYNKAVLQIRDSDTGDVVRQFPTEGQLRAYQNAQQFSERQKAQTNQQLREASGGSSTPAPSVSSPVAADVSAPSVTEVSVPQAGSVETEA